MVVVSDLMEFQPKPINYVGRDAQKVFVREVERIRDEFYIMYRYSERMVFTERDKVFHDSQKRCYDCGGEFRPDHQKRHKVRDHCHFTGCYRGALHNVYNLHMNRKWCIPVFFHNLSGYDSHLFLRELSGEEGDRTDVSAIPENEQKYISFVKDKYVDVSKGDGKTFR